MKQVSLILNNYIRKWKAASNATAKKIIVKYGAVTLYAFHANSDVGSFVNL